MSVKPIKRDDFMNKLILTLLILMTQSCAIRTRDACDTRQSSPVSLVAVCVIIKTDFIIDGKSMTPDLMISLRRSGSNSNLHSNAFSVFMNGLNPNRYTYNINPGKYNVVITRADGAEMWKSDEIDVSTDEKEMYVSLYISPNFSIHRTESKSLLDWHN